MVAAVVSWYQAERADDVALDQDGDALLFQWGTYDSVGGPSFQYDITRQLILEDEEDDAFWQLSVTLHFLPTAETKALGSGNRWCLHPAEADAFRSFVEASGASIHVRGADPARTETRFGPAG